MSQCNNSYSPAVITPVLAAGSTTSPFFIQVNISQKLCSSTCVANTPVFVPKFSLVNYATVGTNEYVATIHVEGVISYVPCNGTPCCTRSQLLSQDFTVPFKTSSAPTSVTIAQGTTVNAVAAVACHNCSRNFVSETPITLTIA